MRAFSSIQWWHGDKKLTRPKVVGRLKVFLVRVDTRWLPAPSHACFSLRNGKLSGAVRISFGSWVDSMVRSKFPFLECFQRYSAQRRLLWGIAMMAMPEDLA